MSYFLERDKKLIEKLLYNPNAKPGFNIINSTLTWADEYPEGLSKDGQEKLNDLWIARTIIYHNPDMIKWVLNPEHYKQVWEVAKKEGIEWPGFREERLFLSGVDQDYYQRRLEEANDPNEPY